MIPGIIRLVSATLVTIGKARVFGYGWECGKGMHRLTIEGGIEGHEIFLKSFVSVCCHSTNMLSKHGYLFLSLARQLARPTSLRRPYTSSSESMFGFCTDGSEMGGWCTKRIERYGGGDWSGHKNKST